MKRFKFLVMSLVLVTCLIGSQATSSASSYSSGKAVIPTYWSAVYDQTGIRVSNITDSPINVIVTLYLADGTMLTDDSSSTTGMIVGTSTLLNYNDQNTDSTVTFTLNAHCTGSFTIEEGTRNSGYGIIQWTQNGNALQGLVAYAQLYTNKSDYNEASRASIEINCGLPF
jgi:hypothetical protein